MGKLRPVVIVNIVIAVVICNVATYTYDLPCAFRADSDSWQCVCNATYCDEVTRETPVRGRFNAYTTTRSGLRFSKTEGTLWLYRAPASCTNMLELDPMVLYQSIEGFGGAVTDSSAALWINLTDPQLMDKLINSYFGESGIEYNMIRLPIASTDFSPKVYSYQDYPQDDASLSNFSLAYEDYQYKIPMIKAASKTATAPVHIVASAWSPPLWMKTKFEVSGVSMVQEKYYEALALYHYKFLEHYKAEDVDIWGLSSTNEPLSGIMSLGNNIRVTWTSGELGKWIANYMGPKLRNSEFKDIKYLVGDDFRMSVGLWFNLLVKETPEALQYIDGIAIHFYFDDFTAPEMLTYPLRNYQDKFTLYTEASIGINGDLLDGSVLSAWGKAQKYIRNIIEDLNYNVTGFIDWNLCLNPEGGPSWSPTRLDAPILVNTEKKEFVKQPMFYALGHVSKFLPRGSRRIAAVQKTVCKPSVDNVAFLTPDNTIVTVLHNEKNQEEYFQIRVGLLTAELTLPPESITTVEFPYEASECFK